MRWVSLKGTTVCPACGTVGQMGLHARYMKYHFATSIEIQRVRCKRCGTTHALIPQFSVPGMSLGREEAERCLQARGEGASRSTAAAELVQCGWEVRVGKRLERKIATSVQRAKVIWPKVADVTLEPWAWMRAACGSTVQPILQMNRFALEHRVNAICFCRAPILLFRAGIRAGLHSHTRVSVGRGRPPGRLRSMQRQPGGTP